MGNALKLMLIMFSINSLLYFGGIHPNLDAQNSILGLVFNINTLNQTTGYINSSTTIGSLVPINQTFASQVGSFFGLLFTPVVFIFSLVSFLFNFLLAPLGIFQISGMPFMFKVIFGGGLTIVEIFVMLSLLTGRDI